MAEFMKQFEALRQRGAPPDTGLEEALYSYNLNSAYDLQGKERELNNYTTGKVAAFVQGAARPLATLANAAINLANTPLPSSWEIENIPTKWRALQEHPVAAAAGEGVGLGVLTYLSGGLLGSLPTVGRIYRGMSLVPRAVTANAVTYAIGMDPHDENATILRHTINKLTQNGQTEYENNTINESELAGRLYNAATGGIEAGLIEGLFHAGRMLKASSRIKGTAAKVLGSHVPESTIDADKVIERIVRNRTESFKNILPEVPAKLLEDNQLAITAALSDGAPIEALMQVTEKLVNKAVKDGVLTMDFLRQYADKPSALERLNTHLITGKLDPKDFFVLDKMANTYLNEAIGRAKEGMKAANPAEANRLMGEFVNFTEKYTQLAMLEDQELTKAGRTLVIKRYARPPIAFRQIPSNNLWQIMQHAAENPKEAAKFMAGLDNYRVVTFKDAFVNAFMTGLIGTTRSVIRNTLGGINRTLEDRMSEGLLGFYRWGKGQGNFYEVADEVASAINPLREYWGGSLFGKMDTPFFPTIEMAERFSPEPALMYLDQWQTGKPLQLVKQALRAHVSFASTFSKLNNKADMAIMGYNYRSILEREARRMARSEGLSGAAFRERVQGLIENPRPEIMELAEQRAREMVFREELPEFMKMISQAQQNSLAIRILLPFLKTPYNIVRYEIETTPLIGLAVKGVRDDLAAGGIRAARVWTRWANTSMQMAMAGGLSEMDRLTGYGPEDPTLRRIWLQNHRPYSIKIGNQWISYAGLEPVAQRLGVVADFFEILREAEPSRWDQLFQVVYTPLMRDITRKSMLYNVGQLYNMTTGATTFQKGMGQIVGSIVAPPSLSPLQSLTDPYYREARTALDSIKARIPGLSRTIEPRIDVFGNPILRDESWWRSVTNTFVPFAIHPAPGDKVIGEMMRLHMYPGWASEAIGGPEEPLLVTRHNTRYGVQLNPKEYRLYQEYTGKLPVGGKALHERLDETMQSPIYKNLADDDKAKAIRSIFAEHRANAREHLINSGVVQDRLSQVVSQEGVNIWR